MLAGRHYEHTGRCGIVLQAKDLGRRIDDAWLWRGVDVTLRPGESLAVVGPTGAGKTLLLRCLAGLDGCDRGTIALDGRALDRWHMPRYRSRVVYVHQRPTLPEGTVEGALRAPFRLAVHRHRRYDGSRTLERLSAFERDEDFLAKDTDDLSGGEAQIVALIRALSIVPSVLLLDEPTASMDARATEQAEALLTRWVDDASDRAAIWTSHDRAQLGRVADRTFVLAPDRASAP